MPHTDTSQLADDQNKGCLWRTAVDLLRRSRHRQQVQRPPAETEQEAERKAKLRAAFTRAQERRAAQRAASLRLRGKEPVPRLMFDLFDESYIDLGQLAIPGLVLYLYPGCGVEGRDAGDEERWRHAAFAGLLEGFSRVIPGGAVVAASSISQVDQFRQEPDLVWEQFEKRDFCRHLVSDESLYIKQELGVPTFQRDGRSYFERLTLVVRGGLVEKVFYPIGQPGEDARKALAWLQLH